MSWSRAAAVLLLLGCSSAACAATGCPSTSAGRPLSGVEVFDGLPAELASLEPGDGGWKLDYRPASTDGHFYLNCQYGSERAPVMVKLPIGVSSCRIKTYPQVSCR